MKYVRCITVVDYSKVNLKVQDLARTYHIHLMHFSNIRFKSPSTSSEETTNGTPVYDHIVEKINLNKIKNMNQLDICKCIHSIYYMISKEVALSVEILITMETL